MPEIVKTYNGRFVTIEQVRNMPVIPELWCAGQDPEGNPCGGKMWVCALLSEKVRAHFAGSHIPNCDHGSEKTKSRLGDRGHSAQQRPLGEIWEPIGRKTKTTSGPDGRYRPNESIVGTQTQRSSVNKNLRESEDFKKRITDAILNDLVADISLDGVMAKAPDGRVRPARNVFIHARNADATRRMDNKIWVWGLVNRCKRTLLNGLMCKIEGASDDLGILLTDKNLKMLKRNSVKSITGNHIMATGRFVNGTNGIYLMMDSVDHIGFDPPNQHLDKK